MIWLAYLAQALSSVSHDIRNEVHTLHPPESLRCAACRIPIPTMDHFPDLWRLAHCRHPLHLDCLAPLGRPYAVSRATQRPYYVHNPGSYLSYFLYNHSYVNIRKSSCHTNPKAKTTQPTVWLPPNLTFRRCAEDENMALPSRRMWPSPVLSPLPWWLVLECARYDYWRPLN